MIGQIGTTGTPFNVGTYLEIDDAPAGELYLGVNDNNYPDNTGAWIATIDQNAKSLGACPCNGSYQGVLPSSAGDPENPGSGTDAGGGLSGYGGGSWGSRGGGAFARLRTNANAGGAGPRAVTGHFSVDIATGNLSYEDTDYTTAGQNPLSFTRYYNSRASVSGLTTYGLSLVVLPLNGPVGANWRSNYERNLQITSTTVTAERFDGQQLTFTSSGGAWTPDSDIDITLTNAGKTWTLTTRPTRSNLHHYRFQRRLTDCNSIANGYTQKLTYDSAQKLTTVTDSYNRTLTLDYNSNGMLEKLTTPNGTTIAYGYTRPLADGYNLTSVTYPTTPSSTVKYSYPNTSVPDQLWGVTDENGNSYISWTYPSYSRVGSSHIGGSAHFTTYSYNADGTTTITGPNGVADTFTFSMLQGVSKITKISRAATSTTKAALETFAFDSNGYLSRSTDWNGNSTAYTNNSNGDPLTITEAVGTSATRTTTIAYDSTWIHLPATIATQGLTTSYSYDDNGQVLTRTLQDTTSSTAPYSTHGQTRIWTNTWSNSLLASVKTPNGNTKALGYDSAGAPTSITDALGHMSRFTANTAGGLPETIVDPNGVTTTLAYDQRQRLTSSQVSGADGTFTTQYALAPNGTLTKLTLPDGTYLSYGYSGAHLLSGIQDPLGESVANTWDGLDDLTQVNILGSGTTPVHKHSATYDAIGRKLTDVGGVSQTTAMTYDPNGNMLTVTDPLGHTTTQVFDALNRMTRSTDANGGVTSMTYDAHNRPLTVTDANGHTTGYVYDGFGDLIQQTSPDSGTTVFHYDSDGNLTPKVDFAGTVTNHSYDALDRILTTA